MKKIIIFLTLSSFLLLFSFAPLDKDESIYTSKYINYSVEREGSAAVLTVDIADIFQYDKIYVRRSNNPMDDFRQVKYLTKAQISELANSKKITDKYPLPGNMDAYYKVVAISDKGVYKLFPCVKLSKYN